jgi:hypothetical protein
MNIERLRKSYSKLSESKIEKLIKQDFNDLTPMAINVLGEELVKRKSLLISVFNKRVRQQEEIEYLVEEKCAEIRNLPCPICKSEEYKLNAIELKKANFINLKQDFHLGCYECLHKAFINVRDKHSLLAGGIWGIVDAHMLLVENEKAFEEIKLDEPTTTLRDYVREYIMETYNYD